MTIVVRHHPAPLPEPCPTGLTTPTIPTGGQPFCGPEPTAGNGRGAAGTCTGAEVTAPCGPGIVVGKLYAYTILRSCWTILWFGGRAWRTTLPVPTSGPDGSVPSLISHPVDVWITLVASDRAQVVSDNGSIGFVPVSSPFAGCR